MGNKMEPSIFLSGPLKGVFCYFKVERRVLTSGTVFLLKNDFQTMLFLFFFSAHCEWGGWVLKSAENSALFFLKPSLREGLTKNLKIAEFSALFKTHPPRSQSTEKNKNNMVSKSFLSKNKYFGLFQWKKMLNFA